MKPVSDMTEREVEQMASLFQDALNAYQEAKQDQNCEVELLASMFLMGLDYGALMPPKLTLPQGVANEIVRVSELSELRNILHDFINAPHVERGSENG